MATTHGIACARVAVLVMAFACLVLTDLGASRARAHSTPARPQWSHPRTAWGDPLRVGG